MTRSRPVAARKPDDRHGGLGARGDETDLVASGHRRSDHLGETDFAFGRGTIGRATPLRADRAEHGRVGVAQDGCSPGLYVVEQPAPVDVHDEGTFATGDEVGRSAHRSEGSHRRVDTAGDDPAGLSEQL